MIKVAITGPESSGKTTLAKSLAQHYEVDWVKEYAREYLTPKGGKYEKEDLDLIAEGQLLATCALKGVDVLISDTDMLVMKVWSEFKYGDVSPYIEQLWEDEDFDLYILCSPDLPYEEDPLREHPEHREELFEIYRSELSQAEKNFIVVNGNQQSRFDQAINAIDLLSAE